MSTGDPGKIVLTDVSKIIGECCARHVPAIVAQPDSHTAIKAAFSLAGHDSLRFEVRGQAGANFTNLAPAVVSYAIGGCVHVFVVSVTGFVPSTGTGYLTTTLPPFILCPEMRQSFRVPLFDTGLVQVRIEDEGYAVHEPRLIDISRGGALIEFPAANDPNLQLKSAVKVELQLDEQVAAYLAEVRHAHPGRYGLMFVESPSALDSAHQDAALKGILAAIETAWLSQRG
ncbi:MAG: PilZ domain-containing protein [Candidatus Hydrogenedentes bacterium]|nr:PilZ domain-containing protein [Candidatus Hydrogenedentota bacterium]